jgi:small subunit ribosomal protein S16
MVKIRLKRLGTKGRPFYRIVVAPSTAGRNGRFVEALGTYDPLTNPSTLKVDAERALHWLMLGAQPTETTAYLLNKAGVLPKYFEARPAAKKLYSFLDKRTEATSVKSALDAPAAPVAVAEAPAPTPAPEPVAEAVAEEAPVAAEEVPVAEAAVETAPAETTE